MVLEQTVRVPLSPEQAFAMVTDPDLLRRWQAVTARVDARPGGAWRWTITPGHTAAGAVRELETPRRLVLSFGWEGDDELPPGSSVVTWTVAPDAGATTVSLAHEGLATEEQAAGHRTGWTHYLNRLVRAAEDGDAGPDPWAAAPDPMDDLSAAEAGLALCQSVLRQLDASHAAKPTPCPSFTVEGLLDHLLTALALIGRAGGASMTSRSGTPEQRVADAGQRVLEAWRHQAPDGTVAFGRLELPAASATAILDLELLVHTWDFARAAAVALVVDDDLAGYVLERARAVVDASLRDGTRFGPEVPLPDHAPALDRLVAFTGRTP